MPDEKAALLSGEAAFELLFGGDGRGLPSLPKRYVPWAYGPTPHCSVADYVCGHLVPVRG
ncbi:hypothetical protein [Paenibacillus mucilaginosus]|uniref:Uncharacterized protein n=1 Tax=Paenibacillus mucilaginosus (strain KNP414) TaxID=1036673 RepID=F8FFI8_PAEMK|nr:hypothetical protein [Paenibacillus mucilaginosus]AEI42216.1 hypothetical protein KNP414_03677 [Paenibacillus mucilaginosus KNP414]MCG7214181.1 hypothetical protein [Paenibacillus mucilaginosus]WDM28699.1 hypothetical protein KCX80_05650 [Paenibacillus mucilaginosus]WFA16861.1 hypothetical protein ERY13_05685 [Paenibacillus mucilaginosus]